jgi:hypothetical protein
MYLFFTAKCGRLGLRDKDFGVTKATLSLALSLFYHRGREGLIEVLREFVLSTKYYELRYISFI